MGSLVTGAFETILRGALEPLRIICFEPVIELERVSNIGVHVMSINEASLRHNCIDMFCVLNVSYICTYFNDTFVLVFYYY